MDFSFRVLYIDALFSHSQKRTYQPKVQFFVDCIENKSRKQINQKKLFVQICSIVCPIIFNLKLRFIHLFFRDSGETHLKLRLTGLVHSLERSLAIDYRTNDPQFFNGAKFSVVFKFVFPICN